MKQFISINDVPNLDNLLKEAKKVKENPFAWKDLGANKSVCLIFLNPSLRTRLSSQKAAFNLGMDAVVLDIGAQGWKLEFGDGTVMDGDKAEHIKEAAAVIGSYFDVIAIRAFADLQNREQDYSEKILTAFKKYSPAPVINMESATGHPLQALADLITIEEYKKTNKPKVVLTWAPHPKPLPQAVANSFAEWTNAANYDLVITHPQGYELDADLVGKVEVTNNQNEAFKGADFIYAKNWSSYQKYGQVLSKSRDWTVTANKMKLTNNAKFMHCLPVRRNMIVEDEVLDNQNSLIKEQAKNRIVSMQTVLKSILLNSN